MNEYASACKEIENILTGMTDDELVSLMCSIDHLSSRFDGLFITMSIGDLLEGDYDPMDIADACIACGATDYDSEVRRDINSGWKSVEDMAEDARFYADDAAEWLLDNGYDAEFLYWPTNIQDAVYGIYDRYWSEHAA